MGVPENASMPDSSNGNSKGHTTSYEKVHRDAKTTTTQTKPPKSPSILGEYMKLRRASRRPLPTDHGDGSYRQIVRRPGLKQDVKSLSRDDLKTLFDIIRSKLKGEVHQDDKTMLMERTIALVAGLPNHSRTQETLTNSFIGQLWDSLDHPPLLYMGDEYKWRRPDGSFNNPMLPQLGAAGTKYSRTCKPHVTPLGALPDPETIYEAVMARDGFKKNPNNVSSILWYWATIIIHDLFWTNLRDGDTNDASSYLDLAPLYGGTQEAQNSVRTFNDGMLKPDTFADKRMLGNPPGVCILLIMFNRFHNHVARNLAAINENGRFTKPTGERTDEQSAAAWKKYDEDLFQTARLVTSGLYINITLIDYVRNIINLNRVDSNWTLDPRQEMGTSAGTKEGSESGVGNAVSAEFNLCYRWHSCISEMDDKWIQDFYTQLLGDDYGDMNLQTLIGAMKKFEKSMPEDPAERTFGGFSRGPDGSFSDDDLVDCLATAIEQPGGAFGARNVPRIMKPVEMLGIIRGRKWNLAGLNEFRKHFGLKAYEKFEDINSDPQVADQLRNLYQHPDYVELYPGIVAEEAKTPMSPGVGIAPTYTISRVVLSDAVSLVRGDRYYTTDYHPGNLTNWGYKEVEYDLNVNHGCVFHKLFIRAFPDHFKGDSVYAHYPMVIPSENKKILTNLKRVERFSFDRPSFKANRIEISSTSAVKEALASPQTYTLIWKEGLHHLMGGRNSRLLTSGDSELYAQQRQRILSSLYEGEWKSVVRTFYAETAEKLLAENSRSVAGRTQLDVVRDYGNVALTRFAARLFSISLKTKDHPRGAFTEQELYHKLALIFKCMSLDMDPVESFKLQQLAKEAAADIGGVIETNVKLNKTFGAKGLFTREPKNDPLASRGVKIASGMAKTGVSPRDAAWLYLMPAAACIVPNQAQLFAQSVNWYLSPAGEKYRPELHQAASLQPSEHADSLLLGYALEGIRMAGSLGIWREATATGAVKEADGRIVQVPARSQVFMPSHKLAQDAAQFPNPESVDPRRPLDRYVHYASGPSSFLGKDICNVALVELFRALFRKKGLRCVKGPQGMLKQVPRESGLVDYMTEDWGSLTPFPTTMKATWGAE